MLKTKLKETLCTTSIVKDSFQKSFQIPLMFIEPRQCTADVLICFLGHGDAHTGEEERAETKNNQIHLHSFVIEISSVLYG